MEKEFIPGHLYEMHWPQSSGDEFTSWGVSLNETEYFKIEGSKQQSSDIGRTYTFPNSHNVMIIDHGETCQEVDEWMQAIIDEEPF